MTDKCRTFNKGLFVVLLGPDGAGKSTVANGISQIAATEFQSLKHFHWRPGLLPKLSRQKDKQQTSPDEQPESDVPPTESAYGTTLSLARYLYYLADFVFGYWFVIRPNVRRGTLVLGERWYYDVIAHPARYGFKLPGWLLRLGSHLLPDPDLTVLLSADPEAIHARKPELACELIEEQLYKLRDLLPPEPAGIELSSDCDPDETIREMREVILDQCLFINSTSSQNRNVWRGFPRYGTVKVWIGPSDSLKNSLRLYHPYSRLAQLVAGVTKLFPDVIARKLFCRKFRTRNESCQILKTFSMLKKLDERHDTAVSISSGKRGPHQKQTAQLSEKGKPFAYAKFGQSSLAAKLVSHEHLTLQKLGKSDSICDYIPKSIEYWEDNEAKDNILLQSTSAQKMIPSPVVLDTKVTNFLMRLCELEGKEMNAQDIAKDISVLQLCDELRDTQPGVSMLLQQALDALDSQNNGSYKVAPCHGDFAPWNVLRSTNDDALFVIDWEYFDAETPALVDLFHFVFMPARLVGKVRPLFAVNMLIELDQATDIADLKARYKVLGSEWCNYILWYFLWLAVRESHSGYVSGYLQKCIRILMNKMSIVGVRPKVLVGAYACEPGIGSEPGVGWNWVEQIVKSADMHVITRVNNREGIEKAMEARAPSSVHFSYVDLPKWLSFWKRGQRGVRIYYYLWQFAALLKAKQLERGEYFDLAHHVTFVNDWLWSFVGLLPIPYIWGPIGSHPPCPLQLISRRKSRLLELVRIMIQNTYRIFDPLYWITMLRAARIVAITQESFSKIPLCFAPKLRRRVEPAIGMETLDFSAGKTSTASSHTILYVGRYHYTKCPQLVVYSFARVLSKCPDARLVMIGDGPERQSLEKAVARLNIQHAVTLNQEISRSEVLTAMSEAQVFLFPSAEGAGMVVLEAMASGLPVVCLDYGGPGEMVHGEGGVCVKLGTREQVLQRLSDVVIDLLMNDEKRENIGHAARLRVSQCYNWDGKSDFVKREYQAVIDEEIARG